MLALVLQLAALSVAIGSAGGNGAAVTSKNNINPLPVLRPPNQPLPVLPAFGPKAGCSLTGSRVYKSGAYCYPFHRFSITSILQSPAFKGCCRPCPEQFGLELGFLEISEKQKAKAMKRFHQWAAERHAVPPRSADGKASPESAFFQEHESADTGVGAQAKHNTMRQRKGGTTMSAATTKGRDAPAPTASKGGSATSKAGASGPPVTQSGDGRAPGSSGSKAGSASSKAGVKESPPVPPSGGGRASDMVRPTVPPPPKYDYSDDAARLGGATFGFGLTGLMPQGGGTTGMSLGGFVSGPQVELLLPCCKVCPEQFLMPASLSDVTTSFIENKEKDRSLESGMSRSTATGTATGGRKRSSDASREGWSSSSAKVGSNAKAGGPYHGGMTDMDTGYKRSACCNMCDKWTMAQQSSAAFIELMESGMGRKRAASASKRSRNGRDYSSHRRRGFVGALGAAAGNTALSALGHSMHGNTGSCCPMCPSLQTIMNSNVPADEAFGGPFGKALESEVVGMPLTNLEKDMLKQLAEEANMDTTAAGRDPGMAAAARARAAESLARANTAGKSRGKQI